MSTGSSLARKAVKAAVLPGGIVSRRRPGDVVILLYHRVGGQGGEIDMPAAVFERQLAALASDERVLTLDQAVAGDSGGGVVVTVDDGYRDFYDTVLPLLVRYRIPATLYLATGLVAGEGPGPDGSRSGTGARSTREPRSTGAPPRGSPDPSAALTWSQLGEAVASGLVTVGAHTHGHTDLSCADEQVCRDEMARCQGLVEDHLGVACRHFAYPWAVASPTADLLARELFDSAALDAWRTNRAGAIDPWRLGRVPVLRSDGLAFFRAKARGRLDGEALAYRLLGRGPWGARGTQERGPSPLSRDSHSRALVPRSNRAAGMNPSSGRPLRVAHVTTTDLTLRYLLLGQLRRLREEGYEVTGISAPGPYADDLEAAGIRFLPWNRATRAWDPIADLRAFAELLAILRRERFDLVHTHNPKPGLIGRVAARLAGVPVVVNTVHGLYATPDDRLRKRAAVLGLEWLAARCSHLELFQSEEDLRWARRIRLVPRRRSQLLGNGTDLGRFDPGQVSAERAAELRRELGLPADALVVGAVGRLVAEKGYRELFAAAGAVRQRHPNVRFLAVGTPDLEKADAITGSELERAAGDVLVTGWRDDVRDLLAVMDVFVLASWREGMPRSAIEAAAMGRPLLLTDIRGCREVARHEREALLVPPRDPEALAAAILRLAGDPALRERLGAAARDRALERFSEAAVADRVVGAYRGLLNLPHSLPVPHAPVIVRRARSDDAPAMARLHAEGMPDAFLPSLGLAFLTRLYRALASDPQGVALVADGAGEVVGFATGVVSVNGFYRRFARHHGAAAALAAAPHLVRPTVLRRLLETVRYPSSSAAELGPLPDAELLSIAVNPANRTGGTGRALADGILLGLGERGAGEIKVVVGAANDGANRFYAKVGFRPAGHLSVHQGTPSNVWIRPCHSSSPSASRSS
jgi:glycosyltransferase involved in cell wall biosynthesis/peptidoglycan/xylan/chitin deacetylase (PgdA/CDA1 family)/ribosomal protein S18 acetylase RimI-like enzyme